MRYFFSVNCFLIFYCLLTTSVNAENTITLCKVTEVLQECIDSAEGGKSSLLPGVYEVSGKGIRIPSNTTFIIPAGSVLKYSQNAVLNSAAFGGIANSVLSSIGTKENMVENVHIVIDGEIDANKLDHPYERGGVEGIDWKWVVNSSITGAGVIHSANDDGIDIDATYNSIISGVKVKDNGGSGVHFGSPRPIYGSENNVVMNVTSVNNGFRSGKNGFDLSWPNPDGAIFVNCLGIDNYRNFQIEASGGAIYNSRSIDNGKVVVQDDFSGADYVFINNKNISNKSLISNKTRILLKRDLKKFLRMNTPNHLKDIKY